MDEVKDRFVRAFSGEEQGAFIIRFRCLTPALYTATSIEKPFRFQQRQHPLDNRIGGKVFLNHAIL